MPRKSTVERADADDADGIGSRLDSLVRRTGRVLLDRCPNFEAELRYVRSRYADAYLRAAQFRYNRAHRAPIDPYRIYWVDPGRIVRLSAPSTVSRFRRLGTVADGDWDRFGVRFRDTDVFYGFRRHFEDGVPWDETAFFDRIVDEIDAGAERWGCQSRAAFERRCARLDRLYESIREHGFASQRELVAADVDDPVAYRRETLSDRIINDEIAVDIGRDGDLLFADGRNRLAIAKVLDVDAVPVVVFRRHAQWVAYRDAVAAFIRCGGAPAPAIRTHPDLAPLVDDEHGT
ncbi:hypothetical protein DVK02_11525 [Halobellus sp. Atlit-31R]|nr:hypothetical protein DVK02_11525 [Halobellus sp. Atlit-31R]